MNLSSQELAEYQLRHRHDDGNWGDMVEAPPDDAADHDVERRWGRGRLFRCTACEEAVLIVPADVDGHPIDPA